jgi:hypothetical protein
MATPKHKYSAYLTNGTGASQDVPFMTHNKAELKSYIRARYTGFRVHIIAVDIDGDGQSVMGEPREVETFKLRGP